MPNYFNKTMIKNSMQYALYAFLTTLLLSFLFSLIKLNKTLISIFNYLIFFIFIFLGTLILRENFYNKNLSFYDFFISGALISLFTSLLFFSFTYIYYDIINPEGIEEIIRIQEESIHELNINETQATFILDFFKKFITPITISISVALNYIFFGILFSFIASFFIKKKREKENYKNNTNYMEENLN